MLENCLTPYFFLPLEGKKCYPAFPTSMWTGFNSRGAGKTVTTICIDRLQKKNPKFNTLTRGYVPNLNHPEWCNTKHPILNIWGSGFSHPFHLHLSISLFSLSVPLCLRLSIFSTSSSIFFLLAFSWLISSLSTLPISAFLPLFYSNLFSPSPSTAQLENRYPTSKSTMKDITDRYH